MYTSVVDLLRVVLCSGGGEISLQLCCVCCVDVLLLQGGGGWFAELPLPLPPYCRYPGMDPGGGGTIVT
jgi:hypothetical protein